MHMRKLLALAGVVIMMMAMLPSCGYRGPASDIEGDVSLSDLSTVSEVLAGHGLSNIDIFESWVENTELEARKTNGGFSDADCRMTVMLLTGDDIKYDSVEKGYDGSYLMFDVDAIENNDKYEVLKEKEDLFTTLFGEMPITDKGFDHVFPDNLKKHGIRFTGKDYSVISIVFQAYKSPEAFIGHTGILMPHGSEYLFLEKIAFREPYRITIVKDIDELVDILSERPDYTVEEGEPKPLVYNNDELVGPLK